jgi:hypothetical protein
VVSALGGQGLPGALLTFASGQGTASVSAGPGGAFRFDALRPGRWWLAAVTAPGHQPFAPEWGQSPVQLEARPGEVVRGVTISLLPTVEYEGRVVDAEGKPVAGAEVVVIGGGLGAATLVQLQDRYRSDERGAFRFSAPEEAILEAHREGFTAGRALVDYAVRVSRKLTMRLTPTSASAATLSIEGTVEDAAGNPVEGALLSARSRQDLAAAPALTRSDAGGRFRLGDLAPGAWGLSASSPPSAPAFAEAAAGSSGLRLRLSSGGRLAGLVRDRQSGAAVTLFTVLVHQAELRVESVINGAGRFELDGLVPGPAIASVVAPGYAPSKELRTTIPEPGATPAQLDFDLGRGGRLTGLVVERGTGQPLAGAAVAIEGTPASLGVPIRNEATSDERGRFELDALSESGVGVFASAAGHHARVVACPPVRDGETAGPVTIELTPLKPGEDPRVELAGIGAALEKVGEVLRVNQVLPGGGAAEVGLRPGDEVLAIDGAPVKPMTLRDAIPLLRGPDGTFVTLVVVRAGDATRASVVVVVPRRLVRT